MKLKRPIILLLALLLVMPMTVQALSVQTSDVYMQVHSGPGRHYPVFKSLSRGESVELIKQKAGWVKLQLKNGQFGWVPYQSLWQSRIGPAYEKSLLDYARENEKKHFSMGASMGWLNGDPMRGLLFQYPISTKLTTNVGWNSASSLFATNTMVSLNAEYDVLRYKRFQPMLLVGVGQFSSAAKTSVIGHDSISTSALRVGAGARLSLFPGFEFIAMGQSVVIPSGSLLDNNLLLLSLGFNARL